MIVAIYRQSAVQVCLSETVIKVCSVQPLQSEVI